LTYHDVTEATRTGNGHSGGTQHRLGEPEFPDVETALRRAQHLVDWAVRSYQAQLSAAGGLMETCSAADGLAPVLSQINQKARHHPVQVWDAWHEDGTLLPMLRRLERDVLSNGRSVRTLSTPDTALDQDGGHLDELGDLGAEVRIHHDQLPEMVVLDLRIGILRDRSNWGGKEIVVIREPSVVTALCGLFWTIWNAAVDLASFRRFGLDPADETTTLILELLGAGCKDETAARKLKMSVRTYRRHVANLMQKLGAESRFQAGARAAQLRLVSIGEQPGLPPFGQLG
jgi:hypothetical protein